MAQALTSGRDAMGLTDSSGHRITVDGVPEKLLYFELRGPENGILGLGWRAPGREAPTAEHPSGIPFLPDLSWLGVVDDMGLTVTWPDPNSGGTAGIPGGSGGAGSVLGGSRTGDPVESALQRFSAEAGFGSRSALLQGAVDQLLAVSLETGWNLVADEHWDHPGLGRVIRFLRGDHERSLTYSEGLGVASLVLMDRKG